MPWDGGVAGSRPRKDRRHLGAAPATRVALALSTVLASLSATVLLAPTSASGSPSSDQASVTELEQKVAADGAQVEQLVTSYDQALAQEQQDSAKLQAAEAHVVSDQTVENQALVGLRQLALQVYMNDSDDQALQLFTGNLTSSAAAQEYSDIANTNLRDSLDAVDIDIKATQAAEAAFKVAQARDEATVAQLGAQKAAAQAALAQDDALLSQAKSNLAVELAEAAEAEAQEEQEQAMAAAAAVRPTAYAFNPTPGSYANPLRNIADLNPERVDQGVDYSGYGPIYAVGDGTVMSVTNSGWPGGTFICYKMSDGPAAGLAMYAAEDIEPSVNIGQTVSAGTVIGQMYEGPDGIETGWADPSCDGVTMARDYGQFSGANSTAFGANYSQMLTSVGAPPGVMQNEPATGSLPPNWPQWP